MASFGSTPHFQKLESSDESDQSDKEEDFKNQQDSVNILNQNETLVLPGSHLNSNEFKISNKLDIVGNNRKNLNKKFSIWSEILLEEELNESMNSALKVKRRKKIRKNEKESDNYYSWSKEDFERKFAVKKTNDLKKKIKAKLLKKDPTEEISRQLKESRTDIIKKIVHVVGEEKARKFALEALDIESAGGMMTSDGNRRRTPGGIFFHIIKNDPSISSEEKRSVFCDTIVRMNDKQMKKNRKNFAKSRNDSKKKNQKKKGKKNK